MKANIVLPTETYLVDIDARDRRAFEREAAQYFGRRAEGPLQEVAKAMPETYLAWLAWHASRRSVAGFNLSWQTFESELLEVAEDSDESSTDGLDPTLPTHTVG